MDYLPITREDMKKRGIEQLDFILVSGDAYVDHPSFGAAIISRLLESHGYTVGIISQPDWKSLESFKVLGTPRLAFMVTGGNIDSMVNHYTVAKKLRSKDSYSPGGKMGLRPDRTTIVYGNKLREAYKDVPIILGGIEASLRRLSHYDYWDNKVRRSILLDSSADLLVYGMAEHQIIEVADALHAGIAVKDINYIKGTIYKTNDIASISDDYILLPDYKKASANKKEYCKSFMAQYNNTDHITAKVLIEPYSNIYIVQNTPAPPISTSMMDKVYALGYMRSYHPIYEKDGGIPAISEVKFSIISNRGCFGNCNFCALAFHQGRVLQTRSHQSILSEAESFVWEPDFKGYIHDVGGPTANFRLPSCKKQLKLGTCSDRQCLFPEPCKNLDISHKDYLILLEKLRNIEGIKKVFVRSGIRYDYLIHDKDTKFFKELCKHHVSGQLKVAPEHISAKVLEKMGKPNKDVYFKFAKKYSEINKSLNKDQFLVPYLMSSHPGSDLEAAIELSEYLRDLNYTPEQVQDFYPTPGTLSTCMYYTELDPRTLEKVYVPKSPHEKAMQRALIQYRLPQNYHLVKEALLKANRQDLIGFDKKCLIRPREMKSNHFSKETFGKKKAASKETASKKRKPLRNVHKKK